MNDSDTPAKVGSSEGLGLDQWMPLTEAKRLAELWTKGCDFDNAPQWRAAMRVLLDEVVRLNAAAVAGRERFNEMLMAHQGISLETLEYLETMRQGPTPEEWAEIDAARKA